MHAQLLRLSASHCCCCQSCRADLEAGHFESGLRSRSSNFGLGSRSESMSSLQGCSERHRRGGRPAGCCLAAIAGFIFLVALTLLLKQRAQLSASAAEAAAMEAPVPAAAVTTASLAAGWMFIFPWCSLFMLCADAKSEALERQLATSSGKGSLTAAIDLPQDSPKLRRDVRRCASPRRSSCCRNSRTLRMARGGRPTTRVSPTARRAAPPMCPRNWRRRRAGRCRAPPKQAAQVWNDTPADSAASGAMSCHESGVNGII